MLRSYQWCELAGIWLVLITTAVQIFYMEPLKREIEWRLVSFYQQQNAQILASTIFDSRSAVLAAVNAPDAQIQQVAAEREKLLERYRNSDADIASLVIDKQDVESYLQLLVVGLFGLGTVLTAVGRVAEMRAQNAR